MLKLTKKLGPITIVLVMGLLVFVFVFEGVFRPGRTSGIHEGAVAGVVNGDAITVQEFNQEFNRRIEFFKNMMGGGEINEAQLKALGLREGVFNELVQRKLMAQAAKANGLQVSDSELRAQIAQMTAFHKDGRFDPLLYKQILASNNFTAAGFERRMREDLSIQAWAGFFRDRVRVSDTEIREEFLSSEDQRDIRYVLLTPEEGARLLPVPAADIQALLKDPAKMNLVKSRFEAGKETVFKGKTLEQVQGDLAKSILASEKTTEIMALLKNLAEDVRSKLTADKSSDAAVNALLKGANTTVRSTGFVPRSAGALPGVGQAPELLKDAFAEKSPVDPKAGGSAKVYASGSWWLVAVVAGKKSPNLAELDAKVGEIRSRLAAQKERGLTEEFLKTLQSKAKIVRNEDVLGTKV